MSVADAVPVHPALDRARRAVLDQLVEGLSPDALQWLSGYVAGLAATRATPRAVPEEHAQKATAATVLYASQTGHGRQLAERAREMLESAGLAVRVVSTADYQVRQLAQERLLLLIASTHGDGEPPDEARAFNDLLLGKRAPRLERLAFAVLALGDSSYPRFCEIGRLYDERLHALGARRVMPRVDCDVDFETPAAAWMRQALDIARTELGAPRLAVVTPLRPAPPAAPVDRVVELDVLAVNPLTSRDNSRLVAQVELAMDGNVLPYEPGDSLGVWPRNPPEVVARVLQLTGLDGTLPVEHQGRRLPLEEWLTSERELTRLTRPFLESHARLAADGALQELLSGRDAADLHRMLKTWQLADLLERHPGPWTAQGLVESLRALTPRLYSIASSRRAVGNEIHLTVGQVAYERAGEQRFGAASRFLCTRDFDGATVRASLEPNPRFRLPDDDARDVIMIGPGTGVAPFRAFLQERVARGAGGRHWLFFGARHRHGEFLYQSEWLDLRKRGLLQRLDVAFSRDQAERIYVQQRLREHARELFHWLESGAHIYVCGDGERMAPAVEATVVEIVAGQGGRTPESAAQYVAELAAARRYLRDVY